MKTAKMETAETATEEEFKEELYKSYSVSISADDYKIINTPLPLVPDKQPPDLPVTNDIKVKVQHTAALNAARQFRKIAEKIEPKITSDIVKIALEQYDKNRVFLLQTEQRLKTTASLYNKIKADALDNKYAQMVFAEQSLDVKRYTEYVESTVVFSAKDSIRYTFVTSTPLYKTAVKNVMSALEEAGYKVYKTKNFWKPGDAYDGINIQIYIPLPVAQEVYRGTKADDLNNTYEGILTTDSFFEVQLHTIESYAAKGKLHGIYKQFQMSTDTEERKKLWNEMVSYTKANVPREGFLDWTGFGMRLDSMQYELYNPFPEPESSWSSWTAFIDDRVRHALQLSGALLIGIAVGRMVQRSQLPAKKTITKAPKQNTERRKLKKSLLSRRA